MSALGTQAQVYLYAQNKNARHGAHQDERPTLENGTLLGMPHAKELLVQKVVKPLANPKLYESDARFRESSSFLCVYGRKGSGVATLVDSICWTHGINLVVLSDYLYDNDTFKNLLDWLKNEAEGPCMVLFDHYQPFDMRMNPEIGFRFFMLLDSPAYGDLVRSKQIWFVWSPGDVPSDAYHPGVLVKIPKQNFAYAYPLETSLSGCLFRSLLLRRVSKMCGSAFDSKKTRNFLGARLPDRVLEIIVSTTELCARNCVPGDIADYIQQAFVLCLDDIGMDKIGDANVKDACAFPTKEHFANAMQRYPGSLDSKEQDSVCQVPGRTPFEWNKRMLGFRSLAYQIVASDWRKFAGDYDGSHELEDELAKERHEEPSEQDAKRSRNF